ncbi:dehydrogenase [Aminobacter niigataensis]|uniref:dehydrogenase n=1 Tax=Aminobacter niigataensis TaxID=83265 RepID=UPI00298F3638|nr:dehydrogenase [Aminobacter niigataensis]
MKQTLILIATAFACLMAAGCASTPFIRPAVPPQLERADTTLTAACNRPVRLTVEMTQRNIERLWTADRKALIDCGKRHGALVDFYNDRDARLRGTE